jgi:hypothetical protein
MVASAYAQRQPAGASSSLPNTTGAASAATKIVVAELAVVTLTQNVAVPVGDGQVQVAFVIHLACLALLITRGLVRLNLLQTSLYLTATALAIVSHVVAAKATFSLPSLLLFVCLYVTFCFSIPLDGAAYRSVLRAYQLLACAVCALVALDWCIQLVGLPMPNMQVVVPQQLWLEGYAYVQPLVWGSPLMKPNALVFPETSGVGQFLAIAFIIEIVFFRRNLMIALFLGAIVATFSGSGMLLVAVISPFLLRHLSRRALAGLAFAAVVAAVVGSSLGVFENIAQRSGELERQDSSGYARFVAPLHLMGEALSREPAEVLFGVGAGNAPKAFNVIWTPAAKALYEYGLPFACVFLALTFAYSLGSGRPASLGFACLVVYHVLGGGFIVPWSPLMTWLLVGAYVISSGPSDRSSTAGER